MKQPQQITDLLNEARTAYIDFVIANSTENSKTFIDLVSRIATELDITEQAALRMVKGDE